MLRSKFFWFIVVVAIVAVVWWMRRDTGVLQEVYTVGTGDVVETVSVSGSLVPVTAVDLSFEAIGTVAWVGVDVGDRVVAGQTLIKLDRDKLAADYAVAQQNVYKAVQEEELQRRHWEDLKPEQREQYKASVAQARAQLSAIAVTMSKSTLEAPISGIVTLQEAQEGERVKEVGTVVRIIADDAFEVEALVPESDILDFAVGTQGVATFDALGSEYPVDVVVSRIEPEATTIQDVVYYKVFFDAARLTVAGGMTEGLRSGMSVDVDLVMAEKKDVVRIPRRLVGQDGEGFFVTMSPGADAAKDVVGERRSVMLGIQGDDGMVEIVSGLTAGEEVTKVTE